MGARRLFVRLLVLPSGGSDREVNYYYSGWGQRNVEGVCDVNAY